MASCGGRHPHSRGTAEELPGGALHFPEIRTVLLRTGIDAKARVAPVLLVAGPVRRHSIRHSPAQPAQPRHVELAHAAEPVNFASRQISNQQRHQVRVVDEFGGEAEIVSDKVLHPAASLLGKLIDDSLNGLAGEHERSVVEP